jgi:hypothetical protein
VTHENDGLESILRSALAEHTALGVPGRSAAVSEQVRAGLASAAGRRRHRGRRLGLALVVVAVVLAIAAGAALATGVLNRDIIPVPVSVWQQHFQQQHHGTTGKGSAAPGQPATLAEAQRRAGFRVHTLKGVTGAELTRVTATTVTFRDGSQEPEVTVDYQLGDVAISIIEVKDPNPTAPFEVPGVAPSAIRTIDGAQYLFGTDSAGQVTYVQFKTTDGIVFSVNFYGPSYGPSGKGSIDPRFATDVIRHIG